MPINTPCAAYSAALPAWKKVRDAREGSPAVKRAKTEYLPRLSEQTPEEYDAYCLRALFLPVAGRTTNTMVGLALYREPQCDCSEKIEAHLETIGPEGEPWLRLVATLLRDQVSVGRHIVVVDADEEEGSPPRWAHYFPESLINWRTTKIDGKERVSLLVFSEEREVFNPEDPYVPKTEQIYRELALGVPPTPNVDGATREEQARQFYELAGFQEEDLPNGGIYYQVVWRKNDSAQGRGKAEWVRESVVVPRRMGGKPFTEIPAVIFNSTHLGTKVSKPPMEDLADVNLSHYRNSADLEHGRHYTALPTAWFAGWELKDGEKITIGGATAFVTEQSGAKADYLEFSGAGLGHIQTGMESKEALMAVIGSRFLEPQKSGAEKPEAIRLRQAGDHATLSEIMDVTEEGVIQLLRFTTMFTVLGDPSAKDIGFRLSREFGERATDPQLLQALMAGTQQGLVSHETFLDNFERMGLLPEGVDFEEERRRIILGIPGGLDLPGGDVTNEPPTDEEPDPEPE